MSSSFICGKLYPDHNSDKIWKRNSNLNKISAFPVSIKYIDYNNVIYPDFFLANDFPVAVSPRHVSGVVAGRRRCQTDPGPDYPV